MIFSIILATFLIYVGIASEAIAEVIWVKYLLFGLGCFYLGWIARSAVIEYQKKKTTSK